MEAQVTLKVTPTEFDLWRDALVLYARTNYALAREGNAAPRDRNEARSNAARAKLLLEKVGR